MIPSAVDLYALEKSLANRSTTALRTGLRNAIKSTTNSKTYRTSGDKTYSYDNTGLAVNSSGARAVFKDKRLQRIAIKAQHYIFKQNYGFEGSKKNGVNMRLEATSVLLKALNDSNVLEDLADEISEIRLSEVTAKINFI